MIEPHASTKTAYFALIESTGTRRVTATPVPQFLPPYAPEGSLNRFRGALGKDILTTSSTNRRVPALLANFLVLLLECTDFKFKCPSSLPAHLHVSQLENQNPGYTNPGKEHAKSMRIKLSPRPIRWLVSLAGHTQSFLALLNCNLRTRSTCASALQI